MFSAIALQTNISAALITLVGVILAAFALGLHKMKGLTAKTKDAQGASGIVTIDGESTILLDRVAQRLLSVTADEISTLQMLSGIAVEAPSEAAKSASSVNFATALEALVHNGTRFEMMICNDAGALLAATGAPAGRYAEVRLRAATSQELLLAEEIASRAKIEALLEITQTAAAGRNGIAVCVDREGQIAWHSPAFDLLPPNVQGAILRLARSPSAVRDVSEVDDRPPLSFVLADGRTLYLVPETTVLGDGRNLWVGRDVTREREAEAAFRRFVHTMADTFAHLKMSLMIFDDERRLTLFNPATVDILAIDAAWMAQRPTLRALLDRMREARMTPEQANFIEWRDRVLKATAPTAINDQNVGAGKRMEDVWHLTSGRSLHVLARPHPSGGLAVIIEDISDAMALRRQSVSDRAVQIATADVLEEAIVVFAPDGVVRLSNAAFRSLWGTQDEEAVLGQHVREIATACKKRAPDPTFWQTLIDCVTGQLRRSGVTTKLLLTDGITMQARISSVPDGSVLAVFSDITDSERIAAALTERNNALEQAQEMRATLIDQISHQMRTPLNSIFGFGQLLREEHFGDLNDLQTEYVGGIITASGELLSAISGMTDIIDLDEDPESTVNNSANATRILHDVVAIVNERHGAERARVVLPEPPLGQPPEDVAAQQGHLRQIVFNLIADTLSLPDEKNSISEVAEIALGADGDLLVITCTRFEKRHRATATLAYAMASRLANILSGSVTLEVIDTMRVIRCELPIATTIGKGRAVSQRAEIPAGEIDALSGIMDSH